MSAGGSPEPTEAASNGGKRSWLSAPFALKFLSRIPASLAVSHDSPTLMAPSKPRTIFLLRLLQLNSYNFLVERLRPFDLTPIQYMVLSISSNHGSWSTAELARRFQIAPQSMTEIVALLESKKLIARSKSAEHGRVLTIRLTAAGLRCLEKCDRAVDKLEREAFAAFAADELALFRELVNKALHTIREPEPTGRLSHATRRANGHSVAAR